MCEALLEFTEGWGVLEKIPSVGEVWIFSGTTQYTDLGKPNSRAPGIGCSKPD